MKTQEQIVKKIVELRQKITELESAKEKSSNVMHIEKHIEYISILQQDIDTLEWVLSK